MAHVLFMDIVAYSKLPMDEQHRVLSELQEAVRNTPAFAHAQAEDKLIRLPTGDGMALVFFGGPESPVHCALELSHSLRQHPEIKLRMGIHTGPVYRVADINAARNVAGGGINMAQRVMDCGDAGHILMSKVVADMLAQVSTWSKVVLQDLGEAEVKHGVRVHIYNLCADDTGNAELPQKLQAAGRAAERSKARRKKLWLATVGVVALLAGIMVLLAKPFHHLPEQKHIAVLPFQNIGNDAASQAFTEGVVESLTSKLSQLERFQKSFWVVPSSDARQVKSLDDAYRKLNVTLAVTGSIQHTGNGVVLIANLVDAKNHKQLASRTVRAQSADLDKLQDRVWESVADMVELEVNPQIAQELARGGTKQPGAYELYEQGVGYAQRYDVDSFDHAIDLFNKALSKDPGYALAYAALGSVYASKYALTRDPQWIEKATSNGRRALELNDRLIPVHVTLGSIYQQTGELDKALAEFRQALDEDPTVLEATYHIGQIYEAQGKLAEAEEAFTSVLNRRPGYWAGYSGLGEFYYRNGKFQKAAEQFQAMIDLQPDNSIGYHDLGGVYTSMGRYDDAINILKKGLALKETSRAWNNLGSAYMYLGRYPDAVDAMKKATELDPHNDICWRNLGDSYRQIPSGAADATAAYRKALQAATQELAVNPHNTEVLSGIALYHAHLGETQQAEAFIDKALKLAPNDSDILFTSALVYEIIGRRDQAIVAIGEAVKAGYSIQDVEQEPELRELRSDPKYQGWIKSRREKTMVSPT